LKDRIAGCDNIYIGNINTMYKLIHNFFYELDDIIIKYHYIKNQEVLVFIINDNIFG